MSSKRLLVWLTIIGVAVAVIVWGTTAWQDRALGQAKSALASGDLKLATQKINEYLKAHPGDARGMAVEARILVKQNRFDEAARIFERIGAADTDEMRDMSTAYLHMQQWTRALPLLEKLLQDRPKDPDILHEITAARSFLGQHVEAVESATTLSEIPGQEARGLVQLAALHEKMFNPQEAAKAWARVLELEPEGENLQLPAHEIFAAYGGALMKSGRTEEAIGPLEKSVSLRSTVSANRYLGRAYERTGQMEKAEARWREVLKADSRDSGALEFMANLAITAKKYDEAIELLKPIATGRESSTTAFLLQRAYSLKGDEAESEKWHKRADVLRGQERNQQAVEQTLRESPNSFWGKVLRSYSFAQVGNWREAKTLLDSAMPTDPKEEVHPFAKKVATAIEGRDLKALPALDELPVERF